jgi:N6-adenosine-specific RNA methylase IME4
MDPIEFYFLILPLAGLVALLAILIVHFARKDKSIKPDELYTINELMQTGALTKENFAEMLQILVQQGIIKKSSYETIGKILDESLTEPEETTALVD